jgi:phospholipase/carboxylesterase
MLIHGELDDIIPIQSMENAKSALKNLGADVKSHISKNLGHSIDQEGINMGIEFIKKCNIL